METGLSAVLSGCLGVLIPHLWFRRGISRWTRAVAPPLEALPPSSLQGCCPLKDIFLNSRNRTIPEYLGLGLRSTFTPGRQRLADVLCTFIGITRFYTDPADSGTKEE